MGFIEFPFIEVPKDLRKIVGEPTPRTRAYRREGTHAECGQWIEDLGLHYKGDVGISPAGVTMFVPVQRYEVLIKRRKGERFIRLDWHPAVRLAEEGGPHGIRVNTVNPGPIATPPCGRQSARSAKWCRSTGRSVAGCRRPGKR